MIRGKLPPSEHIIVGKIKAKNVLVFNENLKREMILFFVFLYVYYFKNKTKTFRNRNKCLFQLD